MWVIPVELSSAASKWKQEPKEKSIQASQEKHMGLLSCCGHTAQLCTQQLCTQQLLSRSLSPRGLWRISAGGVAMVTLLQSCPCPVRGLGWRSIEVSRAVSLCLQGEVLLWATQIPRGQQCWRTLQPGFNSTEWKQPPVGMSEQHVSLAWLE